MKTYEWIRKYISINQPKTAADTVLGTFYRENPQDKLYPVSAQDIINWLDIPINKEYTPYNRFQTGYVLGEALLENTENKKNLTCFAAELILPSIWFMADIYVHDCSAYRIARKFGVSTNVVHYQANRNRQICW